MRSRDETLRSIEGGSFDVCVIGGGATGAGCALDAQLRGLKTVQVEAGDFAGATSSKSTKIIHGGVRYLEDGSRNSMPLNIKLSTARCANASSIPCFQWLDVGSYDVGLRLYDWIAGEASIFPSHFLSRNETLQSGSTRTRLTGISQWRD